MTKTIALLGQPNSGKSTLYNGLTGSHQHVGNWPGKTVEQKEGYFTVGGERCIVADLPGFDPQYDGRRKTAGKIDRHGTPFKAARHHRRSLCRRRQKKISRTERYTSKRI